MTLPATSQTFLFKQSTPTESPIPLWIFSDANKNLIGDDFMPDGWLPNEIMFFYMDDYSVR